MQIQVIDPAPKLIMEAPSSYIQYKNEELKALVQKIDNGEDIYRDGILQRAETLNQNGRLYPEPILRREIMNYQKKIQEGTSFGESDHPADRSEVCFKYTSHLIKRAEMNGNLVDGRIQIARTVEGRNILELMKIGGRIGISSRAVGTTKSVNGHEVVQDDLHLICWDLVTEPSTPNAYMDKTFREHAEKRLNEGLVVSLSDLPNNYLESLSFMVKEGNEEDQEKMLKVFEKSDIVHRKMLKILGWENH